MSFLQSFKLAIKSLWNSKLRSFLTMLGIIIGVAAVIIIVGLGNGMKINMENSYKSFGTNILDVNIWPDTPSKSVSVDEMYKLVADNQQYLQNVSPITSVGVQVKIGREFSDRTNITGVAETYNLIKNFKMSSGRFLSYVDVERRNNVCVIGSYLARTYFNNDAIGKTLKLNGNTYMIIGTLQKFSDDSLGSEDDSIFMPYTNAMSVNKSTQVNEYSVTIVSEDTVATAKKIIEDYLTDVLGDENQYYVMSMAQMIGEMSGTINVLVTVLASIAAISLVVGGIGIMNIMLVSVSERTREIGIRKALGAKRKHIMRQFVIEAATTSAIGGTTGIILGYSLSYVAGKIISNAMQTEMQVIPSTSSVVMAFSISVAIGIVFGYLPARKAAKLNPIDALHYE